MNKLLNVKYVLFLIFLIFALWNICWFLVVSFKYNKFVEVIPKNEHGFHFVKNNDGYIYSVKKPDYLSFTGNLGVVNNEKQEALIIWPLLTGRYEYGFRLQKDGKAYEIYVDENLEPLHKDDMVAVQKVKEYKAEIEQLFSRANEMWQLDE